MYCSRCAAPGPLWDVTYHRNIGVIAAHFRRTLRAQACKKCVHKEYWKHFAVLATVGWTSYYSIVIGPVFLVLNTVNYVKALTSKPTALPPQHDGPAPQLLPPAN
jgi:hypothetical protein